MTSWTKFDSLPYTSQLPSFCVAEMRTWLPDACKQKVDAYIDWPGRTYQRRLIKSVAIWTIHGAAAPSQHETLVSWIWCGVTKLTSSPRYEAFNLPYVRSLPSSCLLALTLVGSLVGTQGAPKFNDAADDSGPCLDGDRANASGKPTSAIGQSARWPADIQAPQGPNFASRPARVVAEHVAKWIGQVAQFGLLGMAQTALQAAGERRAELGQPTLARACRLGAVCLLIALEPVRLCLQMIFLGLQIGLAVPCAALGALFGVGVFIAFMHVDPWADVRNGMAVA